MARGFSQLASLLLFLVSSIVFAQAMYKYQDENGNWIFTDKSPPKDRSVEILDLPTGPESPTVTVTTNMFDRQVTFTAHNNHYVPVEVVLAFNNLHNLELPRPDQSMRWVVEAKSDLELLQLRAVEDNVAPQVDYRFVWLPGDPNELHDDTYLYRAPFAVARDYQITQAFPVGRTHLTADSYYAVDLAMPIGTSVYAARGGMVFEVASSNFHGGTDPDEDMASANVVRIMHDDGSQAAYAHLNLNSVRVQPGDRVERGQYIADSGNTGFSFGPHLHFVVMVNRGMRTVSIPVLFEGSNQQSIEPLTGNSLIAY